MPEEEERKKTRSRSKSRERPGRSRSKSRERAKSDDDASCDGGRGREVRRGRKKGESGDKEKEGGRSRGKSSDRRGRSVERKKSSEPIVTLDKNGFPVTLDTKETAEKRRRNRSSSRDGPRRSRSKERGRDLTDEDLSAIKRRSRSSSRERGIGRKTSGSEKDKATKVSTRGRKKPEGLGSSIHSSRRNIMETSKTNSVRGNNTLEKLLCMPKEDDGGGGGGGGHSVAESRGARTAPASTRSLKKKSKDAYDGNMSVMSFDAVDEWGSGAKSKKKSSRSKKPASRLVLLEE